MISSRLNLTSLPFSSARVAASASLLGAVLALGACSPGTGGGDGGPDLSEWLGDAPHFVAEGTLDGEDLALDLQGDAASDDTKVFCEREYIVPLDGNGEEDYANGYLHEVKFHAFVTVNGEEREAVIEFKQHDMSQDSPGTKLTVVPRDDDNPPGDGELFLEWEWVDAQGADLLEAAAQTGTVTVQQFTGEPDATGLIVPQGEGAVGFYFEAEWSETESMKVSGTAPCTTNAVENDA